jgi:magnesium transporter
MKIFHVHEGNLAVAPTDLKSLPKKGYTWLLLERAEPFDLPAWLKNFDRELNPRHLEDIAQANHPSSYDSTKDYDVLIFRSLSNRKNNETHRRVFNSTIFVAYDNLLITVYDASNTEISKLVHLFTDQNTHLPEDPQILVEFCLDQFVDQFLDLKQTIDNKLTVWQKKLLESRNRSEEDWVGLLDFKTDVRRIKMLCEEQQDMINAWMASFRLNLYKREKPNAQLAINLTDLAEHSNRMVKLTAQSQMELESLMQLHFTILSHRTNEIMRILALITGIFLPANLITGIFGMNFTNMPDLTRPHGFEMTMALMFSISGILLIFFRWRKWL